MRKHGKLAGFFIICAAVCLAGIICAVAGTAAGGMQDIEKVAERYDWIQGGAGERGITGYEVEEFHSIEATGDTDLWIVGEDYYKDEGWLSDNGLLGPTEVDVLEQKQVCVIAGDRIEQPEIKVKNGVLNINSGKVDMTGINLNINGESTYPKVLVCVPDKTLKSLNISGQTGDITVTGVAWKEATVGLNTGDLVMEDVKSGSLNTNIDVGDVEIQGKLKGKTEINTDVGDIEIDTALEKAKYALDIKMGTGDLKVKEAGKKAVEYEGGKSLTEKGGPHKIKVTSGTGDIELDFGNPEKHPSEGETIDL